MRQGLQRELEQSESRATRRRRAYPRGLRGLFSAACSTCASPPRSRWSGRSRSSSRRSTLEPAYVDALVALGGALQLRGAFLALPNVLERSRELLERAVAIAPARAEAHVRLGQTLASMGDNDAAEAAIQRGLALEPDSALAHAQMARLLWFGRARIDEAIAHFERAATLAPEAGYTHLQLALLQALRGNLDAAERSGRTAVELQQQAMSGTQGLIVVGAHTRLGYVHYLRGQHEEAIREYRRELTFLTHTDHALRDRSIIEVNQKLAAAYTRLGSTIEAREFGDQAIEAFHRRLAAGADDPYTRYYVAALYAMRDDVEPVLEHLERPLRRARAVHALASAP